MSRDFEKVILRKLIACRLYINVEKLPGTAPRFFSTAVLDDVLLAPAGAILGPLPLGACAILGMFRVPVSQTQV
jgi:hypothetical protein